MREYKHLLLANKAWASEKLEENPRYFTRQTQGEQPDFLWIGPSDSRVAPDQLTNAQPGEMLMHRNIANLIDPNDQNLMSLVQYAVETVGVRHIIVCGHYGCGGVETVLSGEVDGHIDDWLNILRDVIRDHRDELDGLPAGELRSNRLVELNVRDQLVKLARTDVIQNAFASGKPLELHGWIYDLRDGLLKPLMEIDATTPLAAVPVPEKVLT
ncbi:MULTISPECIES: carbonic anhydrase [unclassified Sphingomonas]|uniref:carbonic anhydrase n=1 Tax=unclassified Sphingomonas TaxID=196159 RepID=UPI000701C231|nr:MULTISPECIES: carbonic anhydrase [unclassified Sphingomonas]KQN00508.1 carbonate dehydratase [Sphingomonas sp. Leaf25]KQN34811.1 carbonate dehydratase [Sphingomonas sp. Leaf42]KQT25363.1 carbonate dehydratase [Sphingomonas sp. Leaf407]